MTTTIDTFNRPDFQCQSFAEMLEGWRVVDDVIRGTLHMRNQGTTYLPQEPAEEDEAYALRLNRSVFFNAYKRTLLGLTGMVFCEDPKLGEDVPAIIGQHMENVDLAGTHLDVFAKEVFQDQIHLGHVFILVDMQEPDPNVRTLQDEIAAGRRPYWTKYRAEDALNWRTDKVNGAEVLTQITFRETTVEEAGMFGELYVTRFRSFRLNPDNGFVEWSLWQEDDNEDGKGTTLTPIFFDHLMQDDIGWVSTELTRIPVAIAYGRRCGLMKSEPPLLDLAYLNIAHWQEYSDYRNILHVANVPILAVKGWGEDEPINVGANAFLGLPVDGDAYYVEHQGAAIGGARQELVDLEQRMAKFGLTLLAEKSVDMTATEANLDAGQNVSELETMARSLQDALELCLMFHAGYINQQTGGSVSLNVDDGRLTMDAQEMGVLLDAVDRGRLSLETWLVRLEQAGKLPEGQTAQMELERLRTTGVIPTVSQ